MKDTFFPGEGYVSVEPIESGGVLVSDEKKFVEKAKVIGIGKGINWVNDDISEVPENISIGDIIFFRHHGFFDLAEHEGKKHYVVRVSPEFILGIIKHEPSVAKQ